MTNRPRRNVPKPDYAALADVKLPRGRKRNNNNDSSITGENNDEFYRLRVIDEDTESSLVKVSYVGYGSDFNEWIARDAIVELSDGDSDDDLGQRPCGIIGRFCLFEELAGRIKDLLNSSRKGNPVCRIVMSFDRITFDSLAIRGTHVPKAGSAKRQVYTMPHMTQFVDLLGDRWYVRGLNPAGDFCFVTPGTVKFYLRQKRGSIEYQLQSDGTMVKQYFGKGCQLVFIFIRGDGTSTQWSEIIRQCRA